MITGPISQELSEYLRAAFDHAREVDSLTVEEFTQVMFCAIGGILLGAVGPQRTRDVLVDCANAAVEAVSTVDQKERKKGSGE